VHVGTLFADSNFIAARDFRPQMPVKLFFIYENLIADSAAVLHARQSFDGIRHTIPFSEFCSYLRYHYSQKTKNSCKNNILQESSAFKAT